ncbi:DUF1592 domain-containing protein [Planctomicrobium sp. SH661]|uniref:DUF1592 domain-containing protein n=1 Tax=Planctomicrobium sp. SH661 TaxID=3448124 RepID=UPI003F5B0614
MRVRCPHCDHRFQVDDAARGLRGKCPHPACGKGLRIPLARVPAPPFPTAVSTPPSGRFPARRLVAPGVVLAGVLLATLLLHQGETPLPSSGQTLLAGESSPPPPAPAPAAANYETDLKPFIQKYCADCHGNGSQEGDFALDRYADLESIQKDRAVWTKLLKLVELGSMPPSDATQPSPEERAAAVSWLDHQLFYVDCSTLQNPGRVTIRRLNRTEYNNTVNDLLGIEFKPADNFPSDDVGHGFDNIGDVLTVPPLLIEKYLAAAEAVSKAAIQARSPKYFEQKFATGSLKTEGSVHPGSDEMVFVSRGRVLAAATFPRDGEYQLRIQAFQDRGGQENAKMAVKLGESPLTTIEVKNSRRFEELTIPFQASAGPAEFSIEFLNDFYDEKAEKHRDRNLHVGSIELEGPLDVTDEERQRVSLTRSLPDENRSVRQAAAENLHAFLPRAFRRPVTDEELARFSGLVELAVEQGGSFEDGMEVALQAILVSPAFLFRVEGGRRQSGEVEILDDYALASRLSYFLWSSCPDDELFELAQENRLHEPEVLKEQTNRMLRDPRAQQLVSNFAGQWLGLRKLDTRDIAPDPEKFPNFTPEIRKDLWKETELFFGSIVEQDRSILELLTAQYTFLNDRLAQYYGIEGVEGPHFRKVDLAGRHRAGLLTQGSVLTLTSYPNRTSPVKRGEWVLSVLLGDAPPPPPPAVPGLDETSTKNPDLTFRESLILHRADPGCASCHKTMDEIGFGLENFDAIGRWRTEENGRPVDASGALPDGQTFNGSDELIRVLIGRRDDFARCLTEKMLTYAIGRGVDWYDRCAVDDILQSLEKDDRFSTLILGVVNSAPFQSRKRLQQAETN